jgi:uncharacterized membrane protein HdeD (DUF308 family)
MSNILTSAQELALALFLETRRLQPRRTMSDWVLIAFSAMVVAAGVFMLVTALCQFYELRMSIQAASLVSGLVFLFLGFAGLMAVSFVQKRRKPKLDKLQQTLNNTLPVLLKDLCAGVTGTLQENPKTIILLAAVIGFALAERNK